ncbi:MAG: pirin family protein [Candidatus Adiutrix sp.]|jgi:redox-sensitive bicupin YhaK (pirin superfamily)|nr:pirin family protein [Candidatus Adiutrix sp.]
MLTYFDYNKMGRGQHGWLDSHFHFSFAEYFNPDNIQFGVLRVVNDDRVAPGTGFDTHPHRDMEIISYVVEGELTHEDSMKNKRTLTRGQVQYMSAGTGIFHSEHNLGDKLLRFLQIWILPDQKGYEPNYGDHLFEWRERTDKWLPVASGDDSSPAPIRIHADVNIYAAEITGGGELSLPVSAGRQAYLVLIEGAAQIAGYALSAGDALAITEENVRVTAKDTAHILAVEMERSR